jgi:hypothetical protein
MKINKSKNTATDYWLDDKEVGVRVLVQSGIFTTPCRPHWLCGSPSLLPNGCRGFFTRGLKRTGREADHSPPTRTEVKKKVIYTSTPYMSS